MEAGGSTKLEAVTRQRLLKTDWKDLMRAVINCWVFELAIALWLLAVTICKWSINPVTNPNPVYSHTSFRWRYDKQATKNNRAECSLLYVAFLQYCTVFVLCNSTMTPTVKCTVFGLCVTPNCNLLGHRRHHWICHTGLFTTPLVVVIISLLQWVQTFWCLVSERFLDLFSVCPECWQLTDWLTLISLLCLCLDAP
jgi:hypothetical protein